MSHEIKTIQISLPYRLGTVNCYLLKTLAGFILIDTGTSNQRDKLEKELNEAGCTPGKLKLILITHGDFDHTGNAAYLHARFHAPVAMHPGDSGMAEHGDMFFNREQANPIVKWLAPILFGFGKSKRFTPDISLTDGYDLSPYGLNGHVISIPGHSQGSTGVLTAHGDLFCGDILENIKQPEVYSLMDDETAAAASVQKLKQLPVRTVYPGHGEPFSMDEHRDRLALRKPEAGPAPKQNQRA